MKTENKTEWKKKMRIIRIIISPVIGALLGFLYYKLAGCKTGACPITSNPWISSLYGLVIGLLIGFM